MPVSSALLARQVMARCAALAQFTESPPGLTRTFLSPPFRDCHRLIRSWMQEQGLTVVTDAMGNLRGSSPDLNRPRLLIGSHIDTVPNAGAYDGALGVVLALAVLEACGNTPPPFDVEVIAFSEEEGVRFGVPFLGSRALTGAVDATLLSRQDANGISLAEAIQAFGLNPAGMEQARFHRNSVAYLEFHVEQGPVLERECLPLAAVAGIAGQSRLTLQFAGAANHAGTTPMDARRDALAGTAEWMLTVEESASRTDGLVATVGRLVISPGASNVVPGEVRASLDVRHASDEKRQAATDLLLCSARSICHRRSLEFGLERHLEQNAVAMNTQLVAMVERAIAATGQPPKRMTSGAGHDAMILANYLPSAMIFLRSPGGISHHPAEAVLTEDVEKAIVAGVNFLGELAQTL